MRTHTTVSESVQLPALNQVMSKDDWDQFYKEMRRVDDTILPAMENRFEGIGLVSRTKTEFRFDMDKNLSEGGKYGSTVLRISMTLES